MKTFKEYIKEQPMKLSGNMETWKDKSWVSNGTLQRECEYLFSFRVMENDIKFYRRKETTTIQGFIKEKNSDDESKDNLFVFSLTFNDNPFIKISKNQLQVSAVKVIKTFKGYGISSFVYLQLLKDYNYIISDNYQFEDGLQLWKKLAKNSNFDYQVTIWDNILKDFIRDYNRTIIKYNSKNIDDYEIWSEDPDNSKESTVLVLSKRENDENI